MQLTTVVLSLFAAAACAAPTTNKSCPAPTRKFGIMALRSASPIHFATASASQSKLILNLSEDKQDAQCANGKAAEGATFYIQDGELYLYGRKDKVQQFYVDRSGMGQGVMQYYNKGDSSLGGRLETKGWAVDENDNLTFNGSSLLACPSTDGSWYVWVAAGVEKPAGQEGCLGFVSRTVTITEPVKCTYSTFA